jgi:hypothetical protein
VKNVKFYNFDFNDASALGSCSHCFHPRATDQGARTVTFSNMFFDTDTVPRRIRYQEPFKAIFYDIDGTLTDLGPKTWATFYQRSHDYWDACQYDDDLEDKFNGVICDNTVEVRSIKFHSYTPTSMNNKALKVLPYDDDILDSFDMTPDETTNTTEYDDYIVDRDNYGNFVWKMEPSKDWSIPFVTGHKYKIHWGLVGVDFDTMQVTVNQPYIESDQSLYLIHNFTDVR